MNYFKNLTNEQLAQLFRDREKVLQGKLINQSDLLTNALSSCHSIDSYKTMLVFENSLFKEVSERWMELY